MAAFTELLIKEKIAFNSESIAEFCSENKDLAIYIPFIQQLVIEDAPRAKIEVFLAPMELRTRKGCIIIGYMLERNQELKDLRTKKIAEDVFIELQRNQQKLHSFQKMTDNTMKRTRV